MNKICKAIDQVASADKRKQYCGSCSCYPIEWWVEQQRRNSTRVGETWQKRKKKRACLICSWTQKSLMAALGFQNISVIVFLRRRYSITELSGYLYPCFTLLNYPSQLVRATLFSAKLFAYTRPAIDTQIGRIAIFAGARVNIESLCCSLIIIEKCLVANYVDKNLLNSNILIDIFVSIINTCS